MRTPRRLVSRLPRPLRRPPPAPLPPRGLSPPRPRVQFPPAPAANPRSRLARPSRRLASPARSQRSCSSAPPLSCPRPSIRNTYAGKNAGLGWTVSRCARSAAPAPSRNYRPRVVPLRTHYTDGRNYTPTSGSWCRTCVA
eukprot:891107-Pleurochrysis_carterae.AAC.1